MASCLAPALQKGGAEVAQVWSRTEVPALKLADVLSCEAAWGDLSVVRTDGDVYIICVKDDAIGDVARQLRAVVGPEPVIAHTSGGTAMAELSSCEDGSRVGVFYPLQSFTQGRTIDFSKVHFFIEASDEVVYSQLQSLAARLTTAPNIHPLSSADRRLMHLAAVFASNFVNHCCALAESILQPAGLDFEIMRPLLAETVAKLDVMSPAEAQTGPALRWDERVLNAHCELLADRPQLQAIYDLLSQSIHNSSLKFSIPNETTEV